MKAVEGTWKDEVKRTQFRRTISNEADLFRSLLNHSNHEHIATADSLIWKKLRNISKVFDWFYFDIDGGGWEVIG